MNEQSSTGLDTEWIWVIVLVVMLGLAGAPLAIFTDAFAPAMSWMVDARLLVTGPDVLLPIADGAGLDLLRIAIVAVALLIVVGAAVAIMVRVRARRGSRERRR